MTILLLNYAHPLTPEQLGQIVALLNAQPEARNIPVQIDRNRPIAEVARELADAAGLSAAEWQTQPLLLNPPGLPALALALLAELHGRCGYFPPLVNIRPIRSKPPRYEVAEIVNLQVLRDAARGRR